MLIGAFALALLAYVVIPASPILALFVAYYLGADFELLRSYVYHAEFAMAVLFVVDCIVLNRSSKNKKKKAVKKYINENIERHMQKVQEIERENERIQSEIRVLSSKKVKLENEMRDRSVCCIHRDYWHAGPQLYYLIDCGRADSLKEAINLYENIRENERCRLAEEAAAEARRWAQFEDMLTENERMDKLERTIRRAIKDVF